MHMPKIYTIAGFAKKNKLSRTTVWRWVVNKKLIRRFKMYDARPIKTADGKVMIEQETIKKQFV